MIQHLGFKHKRYEDLHIEVWGEWNNWQNGTSMKMIYGSQSCKVWVCIVMIPEKKIFYKFKINGEWVLDPYREAFED